MKRFLFCSLICLFTGTSSLLQAQTQQRILWLGNSYVTTNNLPQMFYALAASGGDTMIYDSNAPGGTTFMGHSTSATSIGKIYSQPWDYVILQGQSQEPSFPPSQVATETFPYARALDSMIVDHDSCTETVFYMTWGKKYGDQMNCAGYPVLCTFEGVTDRLRDSYLRMANDNHAIAAPAGMAWYQSWHTDTMVNLWIADNSHPNIAGSYLTACVFYGTIYRKTPIGLSFHSTLPDSVAAYLQNIAHHTVFDSLSTWNIGTYDVSASFTYTGNDTTLTYQFDESPSQHYTHYEFQFGDGVSSSSSGTHVYAAPGSYLVKLIAFDDCGGSDTAEQQITIQAIMSGVNDLADRSFSLSPNPTMGELNLTCDHRFFRQWFLTDIAGRDLLHGNILKDTEQLNLKDLPAGTYMVKLSGPAGNSISRIVKQ